MKSLALRGLDRIQEAFDVLLPIVNVSARGNGPGCAHKN
jgi:hypothetical protein